MVLSKQDLVTCLQKEIRILIHLCGKIEPGMLDFRPTPKQRSTIELLRYLTIMGPVLVPSIQKGAFLGENWGAAQAQAEAMDFAAIVKNLESQSAFYAEAIAAFSEEDLRGEIELFGGKANRGSFLVDLVVCGHAAYRTQLFCYLKLCGREELNTLNLWAGFDGQM